MTIVASLLFTTAALAALYLSWRAITAALPGIATLRAQLAEADVDRAILITTLDTRLAEEPAAFAPAKPRRRIRPKPVTHRLHHFARAAHAA